MSSLIEVRAESLNGINQNIEEWEELEFMVYSGAGHLVVGPEHVKAVAAGEPEKDKHDKLVGGSMIPHEGSKTFQAATEDYSLRKLNAQVTDVDTPLLSVSQIVLLPIC